MTLKPILKIFLFFIILFEVGCAYDIFNQPVTISSRSAIGKIATPIEEVSVTYTHYIFGMIPIAANPSKAHDKLLEKAKKKGGNAVIDVQIRSKNFFYAQLITFPFVIDKWELTGIAAKIE